MSTATTVDTFIGFDLPDLLRRSWTSFQRLLEMPADRATDEGTAGHGECGEGAAELETLHATLRLALVMAGVAEGLREVGVERVADMDGTSDKARRALELARSLTGIDPHEELLSNQLVAEIRARPPVSLAEITTEMLLRKATGLRNSVLSLVPDATTLAGLARLGFESEVHAVEQAAEGLRFFLLRRHPETNKLLAVLGRAYAAGRMELRELEEATELSREDLLMMLEAIGCSRRPAAALRAVPDLEARVLGDLRRRRLDRGGEPVPDEAAVRREVIATQRIEGVDARWLPIPNEPSS